MGAVRYLLDTHAFLWWIGDDKSLSSVARSIIADSSNEIYLSAVSVWEISIKARLGRLGQISDPESFASRHVAENSFVSLPITLSHSSRVYSLSNHHQDPFDQMLIAQSMVENMPLISVDRKIRTYDVEVVW